MAVKEEGIIIEKEMNLSKCSEEKTNSLFIKSIEEDAINFIELLKEKFFLLIKITENKNNIEISNKSILKIFSLFVGKENEDKLEQALNSHITIICLNENNLSKDELNNQDNSNSILEPPYVRLLEQTENYEINITPKSDNEPNTIKKLLTNDLMSNKIVIKSSSVEKIFKFLNKSIINMSDYINIMILYLSENSEKEEIKNKLYDSFNNVKDKDFFLGKKNYEIELKQAVKSCKNEIIKYDQLFENVLNKIDNIENNNSSELNDEEKMNKSFNNNLFIDTPKKFIEQKMKINYEPNQFQDNDDKKFKCQKDICRFCNIF